MLRAITVVAIIVGSYASSLNAANLTGIYLETRTCQVYTGPCFANAESEGLAGRNAIMAWRFEQGKQGDSRSKQRRANLEIYKDNYG